MFAFSLLTALLLSSEPVSLGWGGSDFVQYYAAQQLILQGKNPYDRQAAEALQIQLGRASGIAMFAPPWSLLPSWPLVRLRIEEATRLNIVVNGFLLVLIAAIWQAMFFPGRISLLPLLLPSLLLWYPSLAVLGMGQLSLWPLAGFTGWLYARQQGWNLVGAVLLVLLVIKPHLGLVPGFFVLGLWMRQRDGRSLLVFTAAVVSLTGLTLVWRPTIWLEYYQSLQSGSVPADYLTATLDCFLRQWGWKWPVTAFAWLLWLMSLAGACWLGFQLGDAARVHWPTWSAFVLVWSLATVPYAFSFDLVVLLPLWIWAVGYYLSRDSKDNSIHASVAEGIPHKTASANSTGEKPSPLWSQRFDQASSGSTYMLLALLLVCNAWIIIGKVIPWSEVAYWPVPWCILLAVMVCLSSSTESASAQERTL